MAMKDAPEIVTIEFGSSHTLSSTDLIGLYVDHESACNRFKVREINTGSQEWILSDLQPLYGHQFRGGDLEIKVASPLKNDTFPGFTGARLLLVRRAHTCQEYLPNLPLVPLGRPTARIVRQIGVLPSSATAEHVMASAYIEGYQYVSCVVSTTDVNNLVGSTWQISGRGPTADNSPSPDSPRVFATLSRAFTVASGKGNAAPSLTAALPEGWDALCVAAEPFAFQQVEARFFNTPLALVGTPPPSVIWYFSNQPMTERF